MVMKISLIVYAVIVQSVISFGYHCPLHLFSSRRHDSSDAYHKSRYSYSLSSAGKSDIEEVVTLQSNAKEVTSGLFRKISRSNKIFDYEEILSSEDVDEYQKRFRGLQKLFPDVEETLLRDLVFISPLLLALETESLQSAVRRLREELPYVDPSYVISQRSCGLDLLLSCMSPTFDLETCRQDVVNVIGKQRNATDFLRRVPHSLTPRYLLALREYCTVMKSFLLLDTRESLNIVERWPGILGIDISTSLSRFNASIHRHKLIPENENSIFFISKILRTVPRALMQDIPKRAYLLKQNFPHWNLPTIILKYPRVLTQKIQGLKKNHEILRGTLDPLGICADDFINIFPRALGYNPLQLLSSAESIADALPGLTVRDIFQRAPRLLSVRTRELLIPQIRKLQRSFTKIDRYEAKRTKSNNNNNSRKKSENDNSGGSMEFSDIDDADMDTTISNSMGDFGDDEGLIDGESYSTIVKNKAYLSKVLDLDRENVNTKGESQVASSMNEKDEVLRSEDSSSEFAAVGFTGTLPSQPSIPPKSSQPHKAAQVIGHQVNSTVRVTSNVENCNVQVTGSMGMGEISVTRIIIGNVDIFVDRYPYFIDKVNGWIKDYGPGLAYSVLSAVPEVLTKKTATLRPILRKICDLIATSNTIQQGVESNFRMQGVTPADATLYDALNALLLQAPSIRKKKPADIDFRLQQLVEVLKCTGERPTLTDHAVPSIGLKEDHYQRQVHRLAVRVPRLLIESKLDRIIFRTRLLLYFQDSADTLHSSPSSLNTDSSVIHSENIVEMCSELSSSGIVREQNSQLFSSIIAECPNILSGPSSTLARLFFASTNPTENSDTAPISTSTFVRALLTTEQIHSLLDCNTKTFLQSWGDIAGLDYSDVDRAYALYLQAAITELTPPISAVSVPPSDRVSGSALLSVNDSPTDQVAILESDGPESIMESESPESVEDTDDVNNSNAEPVLSNGALTNACVGKDLGSVELERILCGVFNDLSSAPPTSITQVVLGSHLVGEKDDPLLNVPSGVADKISVLDEVERIDRMCHNIGFQLVKLMKCQLSYTVLTPAIDQIELS